MPYYPPFTSHHARHETGGADEVSIADLDGRPLRIRSDTYTGDNTQNRAIPHGMGVIPRLVLIFFRTDATQWEFTALFPQTATLPWVDLDNGAAVAASAATITAMTTTNFYVGDAAKNGNQNARVYFWLAIG
jgi:hypothetical protein